MENQFVPYELSYKLRDKGFNEECLAYYNSNGDLMPKKDKTLKSGIKQIDLHELNTLAPLYQQIIDWFGFNHGIHISYLETRDEVNNQIKIALKHI